MRRTAGLIAASFFVASVGCYIAAWSGLASLRSLGTLVWFLHFLALAFAFGMDQMLLPEHRPTGGHTNISVLKAYLTATHYRWLVAVFWLCMLALVVPLVLVANNNPANGSLVVAVFAAGWALMFFLAAIMLLRGQAPAVSEAAASQ